MSFAVIRKEAGTNFVLNPRAGDTGNFEGHISPGGATISRITGAARYGLFSYFVTASGVNQGINLTLSTLANTVHHVTLYIRRTAAPAGTFQASLDGGATWNTLNRIPSTATFRLSVWNRHEITIPAAQANGSTSLLLRDTANENWTLDAIQVEATDGYFTTYIDGDLGKGYRWAGLKHASVSSRKDDVRSGGRELTFKASESDTADLDVVISDDGTGGLGMTGIVNNTLPYALQAGAAYQNAKFLSRIIELEMSIFGTGIDTLGEVLSQRKLLSDIWKPDAASSGQVTPFIHDAAGLDRKLFADTYYESGLEVVGGLQSMLENFTMRLLAVNPFWHEDDRQRDALDFRDPDTDADFIMARIDGMWQSLGTGMNAVVHAFAYDKERGRLYVAGDFTTANGVAANRIAYWNGITFVAMGSGANADVRAIKIAPNGDVWIGGDFTTAGGAAADGLAKWDISASTWVQFTNGTPGDVILAIDIDSTGRIYIGGIFSNWDVAAGDFVAQSTDDGATWTGLGTGASAQVAAFAIDSADNLYLGGAFATIDGVSAVRLAKWDGSNITALGSGVNNSVATLSFALDGSLYIGGNFTDKGSFITLWDGSDYQILGVGVDNAVFSVDVAESGILLVGGGFTSAGGISIADRFAGWNGDSWFHWDIDLPGSPTTNAVLSIENGDIFIGYTTSGTATVAGSTTVTYNGTATISPIITIIGTTTANSVSILQWLENQTTGQRIYFDMRINTGEIVTIDTRPGKVKITSNFRGTIFDNPLDPGGLSLFNLLPGDNIVAAFITGTITGVEMFIDSDVIHHGIEGVAV